MSILPKVVKGISKALAKTEKVKKSIVGIALGVALVAGSAAFSVDATAAQNEISSQSAVLLTAMHDMSDQTSYHYSHSSHASHASHASHQSHYSSRY